MVPLTLLVAAGCSSQIEEPTAPESLPTSSSPTSDAIHSEDRPAYQSEAFRQYWYGGVAELTGYHLEQSRYGEIHEGEAVLVYVTEPFSASKQVKLDEPGRAEADKVSVLKLNFSKKFLTGIYPYSLMSSIFTPVQRDQYPHSLKVTTTSQEWCGHTFMQLNRREAGYAAQLYSYFESEGDRSTTVPDVLLEDELWTQLRLDPSAIPTGELRLLPSSMYLRLSHQPMEPQLYPAACGL